MSFCSLKFYPALKFFLIIISLTKIPLNSINKQRIRHCEPCKRLIPLKSINKQRASSLRTLQKAG